MGLYELVTGLIGDGRAMWLLMEGEHARVGSTVVAFAGESACSLLARATLAGERECYARSYLDLARAGARAGAGA